MILLEQPLRARSSADVTGAFLGALRGEVAPQVAPGARSRAPRGARVRGLGQSANTPTPPLPAGVSSAVAESGPERTAREIHEANQDTPLRARIARLVHAAALLSPFHHYRVREDGSPAPSRIAQCGWASVDGGAPVVQLRTVGSACSATVSGVQRCGSVWVCASCASHVMDERAREIQHAVNHAHGAGRWVYMVTLTVRHTYGDNLRTMRRAMALAWSSVAQGEPWKRWTKRAGGLDYVRRLEATHGGNGWHPHFHLIFASDEPISPFDGAWQWLQARWNAKVRHYLGPEHVGQSPHDVFVEQIHQGDGAAKYLTKLGLEMTDAFARKGAAPGKGRTAWTILQTLADNPYRDDKDARVDADLWVEWGKAMHGARALIWSRGWRKRVGLGADVKDEIIAQREDADAVPVALFPAEHTRELAKPHVSLPLRRAVEKGASIDALEHMLRRWSGPAVSEAFAALNAGKDFAALHAIVVARREYLRTRTVAPRVREPLRWEQACVPLACRTAIEKAHAKVARQRERRDSIEKRRARERLDHGNQGEWAEAWDSEKSERPDTKVRW